MPKLLPGKQHSPINIGERVSEFLEVYEIITSKNNSKEKTLLFPFYCTKEIQSSIKRTKSFESRNWEDFKVMLRRRYIDPITTDPLEHINKLVNKGTLFEGFLSFVDEFEYESKKLESAGEISGGEELYSDGKLLEYSKLLKIFSSLCQAKEKLKRIMHSEATSAGHVGAPLIYEDKMEDLIKQMSALTLILRETWKSHHKKQTKTSERDR
ncbi:hypothetical protein BB558_002884 [Smittium angustum]|uniref:Retrotransposon gag domain-containing protein n=1 Tax=Smittium angustum TaxID=133377 RepID=A0A2U1J7T6_SMIAN|nr:hypothetical protein BB558_002884 [Smittium angustum]